MALGQPGLLYSRPAAGAAGPSGLYVARRDGPEDFLPALGAPVVVTQNASGWVWGAWASLGSHAQDFYLSTVHLLTDPTWTELLTIILELAYGDAKTPLDVCRGNIPLFNPGPDLLAYLPYSIVSRAPCVPAGETLYARVLCSLSGSRTAMVQVSGWPAAVPTWDALPQNWVQGPGRLYPSNVSQVGTSVTAGTPWVYGNPVTIVDPAPNDLLVTRLISLATFAHLLNPATAVQVGYGAAGAETWCATVLYGRLATTPWVWPPVWVKAGERAAVRAAGPSALTLNLLVKVYDL